VDKDILRDATIQRFEYNADVFWKLPKELKEEILKEGKIIYRNDRTEEGHRII
jgi:hypothetical protein